MPKTSGWVWVVGSVLFCLAAVGAGYTALRPEEGVVCYSDWTGLYTAVRTGSVVRFYRSTDFGKTDELASVIEHVPPGQFSITMDHQGCWHFACPNGRGGTLHLYSSDNGVTWRH